MPTYSDKVPENIKPKRPGTRKIADAPRPCVHLEHEPAKFRVYEPGTYEHVCPACGRRVVFTVPLVFC